MIPGKNTSNGLNNQANIHNKSLQDNDTITSMYHGQQWINR